MVLSPLVQVKSYKDKHETHWRAHTHTHTHTHTRHAVVHVSVIVLGGHPSPLLLSPHLLWALLTLTVLCYTVASCTNSVSTLHFECCSDLLPCLWCPVFFLFFFYSLSTQLGTKMFDHLWVDPPRPSPSRGPGIRQSVFTCSCTRLCFHPPAAALHSP